MKKNKNIRIYEKYFKLNVKFRLTSQKADGDHWALDQSVEYYLNIFVVKKYKQLHIYLVNNAIFIILALYATVDLKLNNTDVRKGGGELFLTSHKSRTIPQKIMQNINK